MFVNVKTLIMLVIFRTGSRATCLILAGDLVPAGTTLVTTAVQCAVVFEVLPKNV